MDGQNEFDSLQKINEIEGKLKNMNLDNKLSGDHSNCYNDHSSSGQNNYFHETTHNLSSINHLFHINFVRSMKGLRSQDKRLLHLKTCI